MGPSAAAVSGPAGSAAWADPPPETAAARELSVLTCAGGGRGAAEACFISQLFGSVVRLRSNQPGAGFSTY